MNNKIMFGFCVMFLVVLIGSAYADTYATTEPITYGVTTEVDPVYSAWDKSTGISITESQISDLLHTTAIPDTNETTRMNVIYAYTLANRSNWDTAYTWGDHATEGYLTTYTDTNETTRMNEIYDYSITNRSNWDTAFSWGDHSAEGYLTAYTDTNETTRMNEIYDYIIANRSNWDLAYGWGDHDLVGYLTAESDPNYFSNPYSYYNSSTLSVNLTNYYNKSFSNTTYVEVAGDTMTGNLIVQAGNGQIVSTNSGGSISAQTSGGQPSYISFGNTADIGISTDGVVSGYDYDGSFIFKQKASNPDGHVEFIFIEETGDWRFALPSSGVNHGTYNPRSMIIAGPSVNNESSTHCSYWGFDSLDCDTSGTGADLGVQDDLEVLGKIYTSDWSNVTITESQISDLTHTTDTNETTRVDEIYQYTLDNRSNWDTAYTWGDHDLVGYLTSYTDTNETTRMNEIYDYVLTNRSLWDLAYSWGNHALENYLIASDLSGYYNSPDNETDPIYSAWDKSTGISITESQISDLTHTTDTNETTRMNIVYPLTTFLGDLDTTYYNEFTGNLTESDVLVYSFDTDDTSSTTMTDISGNGNSGVCSGMTNCNTETGHLENSTRFQGTDDKISTGYTGDIKALSFWVNASFNANWQGVIGQGSDDSTGFQFRRYSNQNYYAFKIASTDYALSTIPSNSGAYQHIVISTDGVNTSIYENGVLEYNLANTWSTSGELLIGQSQPASGYGIFSMDQLHVYDRELNVTEVGYLYNSGTGYNNYDLANNEFDNVTSININSTISTEYGFRANDWSNVSILSSQISDVSQVGDVTKVGTPVDNQIGIWTGDGTLEGTSDVTYDGTTFKIIDRLEVHQTSSNVNSPVYLHRNLPAGSTSNALVVITDDHANNDQQSMKIKGDGNKEVIWIDSAKRQAIVIDSEATLYPAIEGDISASKILFHIGDITDATGSNYFHRNVNSTTSAGPLMTLLQDNSADDQSLLSIQQDSTAPIFDLTQNGNNCVINIDADGTCDSGTALGVDNSIALCMVCS